MRGGEARAERNSRSGGTRSQRVLERMLSRDGVRRGAYDYISHHHALRACHFSHSGIFDKIGSSEVVKTHHNRT